tara:strand:+ start:1782 stop:1997 length:216 start_codon:yes stop_codon:yes gene_type:complete
MDINNLKELRERITKLDEYGYYEIFKIIDSNNIKYTENNNGIFINLNKLDEKTLKELEYYLEFNKNNTKLI